MKKITLIIYLVIQTFLYLFAVFIDSNIPAEIINYSIIVTNMIFGLLLLLNIKTKDSIISVAALFFTLISDTFLILIIQREIAMISFSVVQILYFIKLKNLNNELKTITKIDSIRFIRILLILIIVFIITFNNLDFLILITTFYFVMLFFNFIDSIKIFKIHPTISIGLLLFILCDIFVGLDFLKASLPLDKLPLANFIINIDFNFIWFFYTPSQVLLVLSILLVKKKYVN